MLVDFIEGDMDRPVIVGALYNGRGHSDAQTNKVSQGAGAATANAPAWFPGEAGAHAHPAVLSGLKSQAMKASQVGAGAYSQLLFDDSPGKARVVLQRHATPHTGTAELNMGHLRHQHDNQLLDPAGFGAELKTEQSAAIRAGKGLLLSADLRTNAASTQMDSREAHAQITASLALQVSMATTAQQHNALIKGKGGEAEPAPAKLAAIARMRESGEVVDDSVSGSTESSPASGGQGKAPAYSQPQLQLSGPMGIVAATPASAIFAAGDSSSITAGQDINFAAQGNLFNTVAGGISLFTYGKVSNKDKPNQETGIKLHAASGKVSSQSQSDETRIAADKAITVASVTKAVSVAAKQHVLMTAQGAYLKLEGGNIMLHGPGKIEFKATMKQLAGPERSSLSLAAMPALAAMESMSAKGSYTGRFTLNKNQDNVFQGYRYKVESMGVLLIQGKSTSKGETDWIDTESRKQLKVYKTVMREDQKIKENWQAVLEKAVTGSSEESAAPTAPLDGDYMDRYGDEV